jgi:hypothetical protein
MSHVNKVLLTALTVLAINLAPCIAFSEDWQIKVDQWGSQKDVRMRPRYNYDPSTEYRGTWDRDGAMRLRPRFDPDPTKTLKGYVDEDGYGRLRDLDGNTFRVKPR